MNRVAITAVMSLLLSGCGSFTGPAGRDGERGERGPKGEAGMSGERGADAQVSGSRIKARYLTADDGARMPAGWFDTTTNEPCAWTTAGDGKTRCLPANEATPKPLLFFSGIDCSGDPVAIGLKQDAAPCGVASAYAVSLDAKECDARARVFLIGAKYTGAAPTVYSTGNGGTASCNTYSGDAVSFFDASPVEPSFFVGASVE